MNNLVDTYIVSSKKHIFYKRTYIKKQQTISNNNDLLLTAQIFSHDNELQTVNTNKRLGDVDIRQLPTCDI